MAYAQLMIRLKRAYDKAEKGDGTRVLVDRLWPRGVSKPAAKLDAWMKDVAPSAKLRVWFGHDPARFAVFRKRYLSELRRNPAAVELRRLCRKGTVTLVYGARDPRVNHAVVLKGFLSR